MTGDLLFIEHLPCALWASPLQTLTLSLTRVPSSLPCYGWGSTC